MSKHHVTTTINGEPAEFLCETQQTMLDCLRDVLGLTDEKGRRFLVNAARDKAVGDKVAVSMATELGQVRAFSDLISKDTDWRTLPLYGPEHYAGFKEAAE